MKRRFLALSLALAPLAGCNGNTNFWLPRNDLLPMVALDDRVAFVETSSQTAFLLDPADPSLTPRQVPVGKAPIAAVKRNGANNQLLVLTKGDRGSAKVKEVPAELDVIDAVPPTPPASPLPPLGLTGRFDGLAQSDDGRFLVLYHTPASQSQNDTALFNPNEMTLIDFKPPENPAVPKVTPKTIRSMGGVPNLILFSPSYTFTLGGRTLAVVLSQNYVTILDLDNPGHTEISVPLCPQPSGCSLTPVDAVFDPDNLNIYVRANGAKDIYQIKLTDLAAGGQTPTAPANDFLASLSMLAVGSTAADMALYGVGKDNTHLAVAAADAKSLVIIDPSTSSTVSIATSIPVSRIIPFIRPALSTTDTPRQQALLVDLLRGSTSVIFADLEEVQTTGGLPLSDYSLAAAASEAHLFLHQGLDQNFVVLVADRFSGSAALTVVDLASRSFSTFDAGSALALPTFETRNPSRLWSADSGAGLFHLNLVDRANGGARLTTGETWLDQDIVAVSPLAVSSTERKSDLTRYLVVSHYDQDGIGNLTFLDAENPDRANARTAYGFLLSNYLEREQP